LSILWQEVPRDCIARDKVVDYISNLVHDYLRKLKPQIAWMTIKTVRMMGPGPLNYQ
jgi:hypothetical protein